MEEKIGQNTNYNGNHLKYWVAFSQTRKFSPSNCQKIIDFFATIEEAWQAGSSQFIGAGISPDQAEEIIAAKAKINPDAELEKLFQENISAIAIIDPNYPELLRQIFDPPPVLFWRGSLAALSDTCLAVVGTRKPTAYGKQATEEIVAELARYKITIVSGLALGIDAIAHQACLDANGKTIAVLGSSVDRQNILPATNYNLAMKIIETGGAVISEYPPSTGPNKYSFPMRNRIVAGLSGGVLVIEAPTKSGALITASCMLENGREVFALPGNIYSPNSVGTNQLIKDGAKIITGAEDILHELNISLTSDETAKNKTTAATAEEKIILDFLSSEPTHIDKIANSCKLNINVLSGALTIMEIGGIIKDLGGKNYVLK